MKHKITAFALTAIALLSGGTQPSVAQVWDPSRSTLRTWATASNGSSYAPDHELGASALAFDPASDTVFLACEKHPALLRFADTAKDPTLITLGIDSDIDIEAMSIHDSVVYLSDEDSLTIYSFRIPPQPDGKKAASVAASEITAISAAGLGVDQSSLGPNPNDLRSIEGLAVLDTYLGRKQLEPGRNGPWFYLLDEQDRMGQQIVATVYIASVLGNRLKLHERTRFRLSGISERFTELFVHKGGLFALASKFGPPVPGKYSIVRCDLKKGTVNMVCDFSRAAHAASRKGYYSNYEGATVDAKGTLFLASDNESQPRSSKALPTTSRKGMTSLIQLPLNGGRIGPQPKSSNQDSS
jgi:hypothetical protein